LSEPLADEPPPPPPASIQSQQRAPKRSAPGLLESYRKYAFSRDKNFGKDTWLSFLERYFERTRRKSRQEEDGWKRDDLKSSLFTALSRSFHFGTLEKPSGGAEKPSGGSGSSCTCPSIKNYPTEPLRLEGGRKVNVKAFYISEGLLPDEEERPKGA
jgi:hypothetical protein